MSVKVGAQYPGRSSFLPHVPAAAEAVPHADATPRDSVLVRTASSLGASAAAGMVTAATFPAGSIVLPLGIAALGQPAWR